MPTCRCLGAFNSAGLHVLSICIQFKQKRWAQRASSWSMSITWPNKFQLVPIRLTSITVCSAGRLLPVRGTCACFSMVSTHNLSCSCCMLVWVQCLNLLFLQKKWVSLSDFQRLFSHVIPSDSHGNSTQNEGPSCYIFFVLKSLLLVFYMNLYPSRYTVSLLPPDVQMLTEAQTANSGGETHMRLGYNHIFSINSV